MKIYYTRLHSWPYNSKRFYHYIYRDLSREVFQCSLQMCGHLSLARISKGQYISKQQWSKWDVESAGNQSGAEARAQPSSSSANNMDVDSDSDTTGTDLYDLESLLEGQSDGNIG